MTTADQFAPRPAADTGTADEYARHTTARVLHAFGAVQAADDPATINTAGNAAVHFYAIGHLLRVLTEVAPSRATQATRDIRSALDSPHTLIHEVDEWAREYGMDPEEIAAAGARSTSKPRPAARS